MEQSYSAEESKLFHTNFLKRVSDLNITKANVKATFNTYQSLEETDLNYLKADVIFGPLRLEAEDFIERLGQSKIIGTTSVFLDLRSSLLSYCDSHFENILNLEEKARSMQDFITIANKTLILNYDYTNEFVEVVRIGAEYESKINAFKGVIDEIKNSFSSEGDWNSNISNWLAKIGAISHKDYTQSLDKIYKAIITKKSILGNSYSEFGNNLHYELHNLPSYYGTKLFEVGFFSLDINVVNQILNKSVQTPSGTIKITWGGHYGGSKDFMHFEIKPNPGDRRYQTYLGTISMTTIKEYLNSFKTESGLNYNY
jgi:hypothetical protein